MTLDAYAEGVRSWKRTIAAAPPERRPDVFVNCCREGGIWVAHGAARADIADTLAALASTFDLYDVLDGDDGIEAIIANAFDTAEIVQGWERANGEDHHPPPVDEPLPFLDMTTWDAAPAPPRLWAVRDRIPLRQPALFSGEGAIGKTLLALQLSAAHVLGRDWFGMLPEPGPAIYFGAEDDADEIHRRVADIAAHYDASFADLTAGGLHLLSFAGKDAILGAVNRAGVIEATPLFHRIHKAVCTIGPKTLVIDTSADVFAGNENDRMKVRQFVGLLRRLAIDGNCSVLLCSHPSLTGISTGTGLSGSTGWHNSVRARIFFKTATTDEGEEPDPELRELVFMKNNYGPIGARVLLRWKDGVFVIEPGEDTLDKMAAEARADRIFLELLARFASEGRSVTDKTGTAYAPKIFSLEAEAKGTSGKVLEGAMRRLFAARKIHLEVYGPPSHRRSRLIVGAAP